jgi:hypothetical protein
MVPLTCDAFTWALVTDLDDVENPFLSEPFKSTDVNPSANEVSGFLSHTFPCFSIRPVWHTARRFARYASVDAIRGVALSG